MWLLWSYDSGHGFNQLYQVESGGFLCFFFNFSIQHWVGWESSFIICFDLFFIGLSRSYNPYLTG